LQTVKQLAQWFRNPLQRPKFIFLAGLITKDGLRTMKK
jgi:hypothetical protein